MRPEPMKGWGLVLLGGHTLVGELLVEGNGRRALKQAYALTHQAQPVRAPGQQGTPGAITLDIRHSAVPVCWLASVRGFAIPESAIVIPLDDFSRVEREALQRAVDACDEMIRGMRASQSGITLADSRTPLPALGSVLKQ